MKAIKDNKSYTVNTDEEAKTYVSRGYDIQDDNGKIKEYGLGKKISVFSVLTALALGFLGASDLTSSAKPPSMSSFALCSEHSKTSFTGRVT